MQTPRFTIRRMMVALAILAVPVTAIAKLAQLTEGRSRLLDRASIHLSLVVGVQVIRSEIGREPDGLDVCRSFFGDKAGNPIKAEDVSRVRSLDEWHQEMAARYLRAADEPWLRVEADPLFPD